MQDIDMNIKMKKTVRVMIPASPQGVEWQIYFSKIKTVIPM
jgi:hypothetical protein